MEQAAQRFVVKADAPTHLAWLRTRLAIERTLMAGARTATGLIGFGFTIVQFFHRFASQEAVNMRFQDAPRYMGLALIAAGVLQLSVFLVQYRQLVSHLWGPDYQEVAGVRREAMQREAMISSSVWVALLIILIGLFAFFAVFVHLV
jgi:putative membrane protein